MNRKPMIAAALLFAVSFVSATASTVLASDGWSDSDNLSELISDGDDHLNLVRQPTPSQVVAEHISALNSCSLDRVMAQYPKVAEIHEPNGVVIKGRPALRTLFTGFVAPHSQGGLCGLTFTPEYTSKVGSTINVQWRADAPFLAEPYRGSDAYETKDGLMYAQVTTFNGNDLKFKP